MLKLHEGVLRICEEALRLCEGVLRLCEACSDMAVQDIPYSDIISAMDLCQIHVLFFDPGGSVN